MVNWTSFLCTWKNEYAHFLLGNCLLQQAAEAGNEAAALFLATNGAHVNHRNKWVSTTGQPGEAFGSVGETTVASLQETLDWVFSSVFVKVYMHMVKKRVKPMLLSSNID